MLGAAPGECTWASGCYRALCFDFGVRCASDRLGSYLNEVFAVFSTDGAPTHWYSIVDRGAEEERRWGLYFDDEEVATSRAAKHAVNTLLWHVNQSVVLQSQEEYVLVHAAGAEMDGSAVVLPARMESGKTTLVAGLVRAGLRYMSDEAVAIDLTTRMAHPYPKSLSVDPGSWEVLADLEPTIDPEVREMLPRQWQVPPTRIRGDAVGGPAHPRFFIAPRYSSDQPTEIAPVSRAEMLSMVAQNTFEFYDQPRRNLEVLAEVLEGCDCYRMTVGDLDEACDITIDLLRGLES